MKELLFTRPWWVAGLAGAWLGLQPQLGLAQVRRPMPLGSYSTNAAYAQQFGELVLENEPLSWIAGLGEQSLRQEHLAPPGSYLAPQYVFSAELRQQFMLARIGGRFQLSVDPTFNVRMRRDFDSWPVKTPSYHIGAWGSYSVWQRVATYVVSAHYAGGGTAVAPKQVRDISFFYLQAGFFHYSNGQDGPPLSGQTTNELSGNFSVNSFHVAGALGERDDKRFHSVSLQAVYCPGPWADEALPGRYGLARGSLKLTKQWFRSYRYIEKELENRQAKATSQHMAPHQQPDSLFVAKALRNKQRWQLDIIGSYGFSSLRLLDERRRGIGKRLNVEATVTYTPFWLLQAGLFLTVGYYGEDPYNIQYLHQYPFARAGIAVGQLRNFWQMPTTP